MLPLQETFIDFIDEATILILASREIDQILKGKGRKEESKASRASNHQTFPHSRFNEGNNELKRAHACLRRFTYVTCSTQ